MKNGMSKFLGGLLMLIAGLVIFSQKVVVYSSLFGSGWMLGGFRVNSGLVVVPLIIGVVWMFVSDGSIASKIMTIIGVLVIIVSVIMSTSIHLVTVSLYEWILILVLIFGGGALVAKVLFGLGKDEPDLHERPRSSGESKKAVDHAATDMEAEIERIKKHQ